MALLACGASPAAAQDSPLVLKPGDSLRVAVWRDSAVSGTFVIAGDGTISHPLYQAVRVADRPLPEVRRAVADFLLQYGAGNPQLVVEPRFQVAVGGEVAAPSLYFTTGETTIGQAIARAGGPSQRGTLNRVRLVRDGREYNLNLANVESADAARPVRSGDQVFVGRRRNFLQEVALPLIGLAGAAASLVVLFRN